MRIGRFAGPAETYGEPLSVVHPPDNKFQSALYHRLLLDATKLTDAERRRLQDEIDRLLALEQVADELVP